MAKAGRPLKFTDPEELQKKIDQYFADCDSRTRTKIIIIGGKIKEIQESHPRPYTIEGLAVALDTCRDTLCEYAKKEIFSDAITRAKAKILANNVECGLDGTYNPKMAEFMLRVNHKYKTESEDDNKEINVNIIRKTKEIPTDE